jgi:putative ABC transport system permease protein
MLTLAWKNLFHDKVRLAVTLVGIVFALVLILVQFGLFLSFLDISGNVVAESGADFWLTARAIPHVNGGTPLNETKRWVALSVEGVERADAYSLAFVNWKLPSGAQEAVQVVGFNLESGLGGPWNLTAGSVDALRGEDTVIIDELYKAKLGVTHLGQTVEIMNRRARVVGFTRGIRSFTTSPYVFTSFKNAQNYTQLREHETIYLLVKARPGADKPAVQKALSRALPDLDVLGNEEMLRKTTNYWLYSTGAGSSTIMGAILGLIVGIVVVTQTIYASTMDHIREFGTLKAMGARNTHIYRVILTQGVISGLLGYAVAIGIAYLISRGSEDGSLAILLPPELALGAMVLAVAMCMLASVVSIRKATTIDPALVFRG